jgi:hypothetical protein
MNVLQDYFTLLTPQQILICNACKFAVSASNFSQHLSRYHSSKSGTPISLETRRQFGPALATLTLRDPAQVEEAISSTAPIRALSCLDVVSGYRCLTCDHLAGTESSIVQHCYVHTRSKATIPSEFPSFSIYPIKFSGSK